MYAPLIEKKKRNRNARTSFETVMLFFRVICNENMFHEQKIQLKLNAFSSHICI